mmetsp:Transcript_101835/g.293276  ORF Transcript_101835/g.293276 Transcript_101835/m.293276 type:complete len:233 (+) Transcript_101835:774-1472(+)
MVLGLLGMLLLHLLSQRLNCLCRLSRGLFDGGAPSLLGLLHLLAKGCAGLLVVLGVLGLLLLHLRSQCLHGLGRLGRSLLDGGTPRLLVGLEQLFELGFGGQRPSLFAFHGVALLNLLCVQPLLQLRLGSLPSLEQLLQLRLRGERTLAFLLPSLLLLRLPCCEQVLQLRLCCLCTLLFALQGLLLIRLQLVDARSDRLAVVRGVLVLSLAELIQLRLLRCFQLFLCPAGVV